MQNQVKATGFDITPVIQVNLASDQQGVAFYPICPQQDLELLEECAADFGLAPGLALVILSNKTARIVDDGAALDAEVVELDDAVYAGRTWQLSVSLSNGQSIPLSTGDEESLKYTAQLLETMTTDVAILISGGMLQSVSASRPVDVTLVDEDNREAGDTDIPEWGELDAKLPYSGW